MATSKKEARRLHLRQKATEAMDEEAADELMESLPPFDWHDLATKADLEAMDERGEIRLARLRDQLRVEHAELRGELNAGLVGMRGELNAGLVGMRGELQAGIAAMRGDLHKEFTDFSVKLVFASTASMVGVGGLFLAAVQLAP